MNVPLAPHLREVLSPQSVFYAAFAAGAVGFVVYAAWGAGGDPQPADSGAVG